MDRIFRDLLILVFLIPGTGTAADAAPLALSGTVTRVIDGDTIDVALESGPIRVRLNGIDTPERGQPWGRQASAALAELVLSKRVEIEPFSQDRYERLVANVFVGTLNVNYALVARGHTWAYRRYLTRNNLELCSLEAEARSGRRGLWTLAPEARYAPWDWRKRPRQFVDYSRATAAMCKAESRIRE